MKTTFGLNLNLYQVLKQYVHMHKHGNKEMMTIKKASLY